MKRVVLLMGIFILGALLFACAPKSVPPEKIPTPGVLRQEGQIVGKEAWQVEWDKIVRTAQREGKVVIYSGSTPRVREAQRKAFEDRFGITLEIIPGTASQLAAKLLSEYKANIFYGDVYAGGVSTTLTMLKPGGVLLPLDPTLVLPEVLDPKVWYAGKIPFVDEAHTTAVISLAPARGFILNTTLVKPGEVNSYQHLLDPKWKSKIILADPTMPPGGDQWFTTYVYNKVLSLDYMRALASQEPFISRDRRQAVEWLARGKYAISIGTGWAQFEEFYKAGSPINSITAVEGDYLAVAAGAIALLKNSPHPNAAKLFINWSLSKEGAIVFSRAYDRQSARLDVSLEGLTELGLRQPGMKYHDSDSEEIYLKMPEYRKIAEEIFGHLTR